MSTKSRRESGKRRKGERARRCRRCGCTEKRACKGGCSWVLDTNVCDACLTTHERALQMLAALIRDDAFELRNRVEALNKRTDQSENLLRAMLNKGGRR